MKNSKFITGLFIGFFSFLFVSAINNDIPQQEVPKYHLTFEVIEGKLGIIVYNAVSGKYKIMRVDEALRKDHIQDLLD